MQDAKSESLGSARLSNVNFSRKTPSILTDTSVNTKKIPCTLGSANVM
jgi:hypothetical protein